MSLTNEPLIRLAVFAGLFLLFAFVEFIHPCRRLVAKRLKRWVNNFALLGVYTLVLRIAFPLALTGLAVLCQEKGIGLFNGFIGSLPQWLIFLFSIVLFDAVIYWQHRLMHRVDFLWRLHKVHHSDVDLDVSTAVRFHPLEIFVSIVIKALVVVAFGLSPLAVIAFEIILNSFSLFGHSNFLLPPKIDKAVRMIFVTPNMHRIHHSTVWNEHNSNYGFALSVWDRCFKSYTQNATKASVEITLGLPGKVHQHTEQLLVLLKMPFQRD